MVFHKFNIRVVDAFLRQVKQIWDTKAASLGLSKSLISGSIDSGHKKTRDVFANCP